MSHSGARQWRVSCPCAAEKVDGKRMHSQVSKANAEYFVTEDRLAADLDEEELRERHDRADGALVACNVCGKLKEVS
ncbi:hypothetical protein [Haloarcula onubensis]|uniref:Uncharacterized protein n=1 Tax=Haloarcula onubensis TaxID=2950539 RepID=A0ABU2FIR7_9EURY|nr:hypothetical protein [Halomicroarcula sp. S3CR25-11]MDS0280648.1 hypothetical protein [Halomicroarcula sp. S3CR25-11]